MIPDLAVTRIGRYVLPEPVPVTLLPPPQPSLWSRILIFLHLKRGPAVASAPTNVVLTLNKTVANPGDALDLTIEATAGVSPVSWEVTALVAPASDPTKTTAGTVQGSTNMPDELIVVSITDSTGRTWTPGLATQSGTAFSESATATA